MLTASLLLNVLVLIPVCLGLLRDGERMRAVLGPRHDGRQILLAIYLAILALSLVLLLHPDAQLAAGLLLVQIIYKLLSPLTVGKLRHPVVLSNLGIAGVHTLTLWTLWT